MNHHKPVLLDLFCCAGGAARGYADAGFDVIGIDNKPQPNYPFDFVQHDAILYLRRHGLSADAVHASPPCQRYSRTQKIGGRNHYDLIEVTRFAVRSLGKPFVIENVEGAPLLNPVTLCGAMFGLRTYRHRLFETNWPLTTPPHPKHVAPVRKMGRAPRDGEFMHIVGNFSNVALGREVMGMPWATRYELAQAIPPAYTRHIGAQLMAVVKQRDSELMGVA